MNSSHIAERKAIAARALYRPSLLMPQTVSEKWEQMLWYLSMSPEGGLNWYKRGLWHRFEQFARGKDLPEAKIEQFRDDYVTYVEHLGQRSWIFRYRGDVVILVLGSAMVLTFL